MVNFLQKLYSKWINSGFKKYIIHRTKLYFLPIILDFKLFNRDKDEMFFLMDKNYHYGFLIETIVLKLKLMRKDFQKQDYKFLEKDLETLDILITKGTELLEILEKEDSENHQRSKIYLNKQTNFFNMLNVMIPELFY